MVLFFGKNAQNKKQKIIQSNKVKKSVALNIAKIQNQKIMLSQ